MLDVKLDDLKYITCYLLHIQPPGQESSLLAVQRQRVGLLWQWQQVGLLRQRQRVGLLRQRRRSW